MSDSSDSNENFVPGLPTATAEQEKQDEAEAQMRQAIAHSVNALSHMCYQVSMSAGWWHDKFGDHLGKNPYCVSNKLMLIVSEVAEAMEGDRKDLMDTHLPHRKMIEVELADVLIRVHDLAGMLKLDLGGALVEKMDYNSQRKDHKTETRAEAGGKKY